MGDRAVGHNSGTIPAKFGLIWFSGYRGEDLNVKAYDGRKVMAKAHMAMLSINQG